ncbi:hypothetical protein [Streptomyces sp. NK08204]|uniref:hypothetical protein n=1 Tax=Streptomyces sp. NK08204 TaxID=2873260 RepID=UPI001CED7EDE|nr:hypothetical protein [Streptomyces sp. NK08204]
MIKQVSHQAAGLGPAALTLAVDVAYELHAPAVPVRPAEDPEFPAFPELEVPPVPQLMGLRTPAARTHRRKVPLKRLTAVTGLTTAQV